LILECSIIFTGLSFIAVTVRGVTRRVNIMSDNAIRLASDLPLNRPEEGKDEISQLDRTFHTMAQSLKEATNKERAILQNASDVICSIEDAGHFTAVNPASLAVFGYAPDEMFGKLFVDFLFKDDRIMVVDAIDKLKKGADSEPIEARFVKKDGTVSDTLWSATWSPTEKTVFCVIHDITERKEAERMKQEVVAMITHDLRTPLSTIRNFHEMLSTGLLGELTEKAEKMLVLAERNSGRMLSLINDLLDVEKIKAGMMELSKEQISAGKVLEHTAQSLSALATESGVSLVCVVGSTPCVARSENAEVSTSHEAPNNEDVSKAEDLTFYADEDKISRVVTNLVSNAIKFSPPDTTIILSAESGDGNILISIKDQGRGIPQDKVANIFDRFQQVTAQDHAKAGGSGLGLAICKAIVELHGGEISVESTEGKGSTFKFSIPRELKS
jgi:PAS domain S-box-containing protein